MSIILTIEEVSGGTEEVPQAELSTLPSRTLQVTAITKTDPEIATTDINEYDYEWFLIGKPDTSVSGLTPVLGSPHQQILNNIDIWGTYRVFCIATNKAGAELGQSETNILKSPEENFINIRVLSTNHSLEKPAISQRGWNSQYNHLVDTVEKFSSNKISEGDTSILITDSGGDGNVLFTSNGSDRFQIDSLGHLEPLSNNFSIGYPPSLTGKKQVFSIFTQVLKINDAYQFPLSDGAPNQFLQTNGLGTLSFASLPPTSTNEIIEGNTSIVATDSGGEEHIRFTIDGNQIFDLNWSDINNRASLVPTTDGIIGIGNASKKLNSIHANFGYFTSLNASGILNVKSNTVIEGDSHSEITLQVEAADNQTEDVLTISGFQSDIITPTPPPRYISVDNLGRFSIGDKTASTPNYYRFPTTTGASGQVLSLSADDNKVLEWTTPASGGAGSPSDNISEGQAKVETVDTGIDARIEFYVDPNDDGTPSKVWEFDEDGHLIPQANSTYDIGKAELKVRHLYLSNNSIKFGPAGDTTISAKIGVNESDNKPKWTIGNDGIEYGLPIVTQTELDNPSLHNNLLQLQDDGTFRPLIRILNENDMFSDSNTDLATQRSIKAYVDSKTSFFNVQSSKDGANTGLLTSIDSGETLTFIGGTGIETTASGPSNGLVIRIDTDVVTTLDGTQTLTNKTLTDPIIGNITPPDDTNILKISNDTADTPDKPIAVQISKPENGNAYLVIADENASDQLTGGRFVYEGDQDGEGNILSGVNTFGLQALEANSVVDVFRSNVDGTYTSVMTKFDNVNQTGGIVDLFGKTVLIGGQTGNKAAVKIGGTAGAKTVDTISAIADSTILFDADSDIILKTNNTEVMRIRDSNTDDPDDGDGAVNIKTCLNVGGGVLNDSYGFIRDLFVYAVREGNIAQFKNQHPGGSSGCIELKIFGGSGSSTNPNTNQSFVNFFNNNSSTSARIRPNGSGGVVYQQSFTGQHATVIETGNYEIGMIVESTGVIWGNGGIDVTLPKVQLSNSANSKSVYGVIADLTEQYGYYVETFGKEETESQITVNSIGEGSILVTDLNGNIENGDLITSSEIAGYGALQSDDLYHSYTVAKCTETIDWSNVTDTIDHNGLTYKYKLIGCTYHCG